MEVDSWSTDSQKGLETSDNLIEDLPKYFLHGIMFSVVQIAMVGIFESLFIGLVFGGMIFTALWMILFFLVGMAAVFGLVNSLLAERLWSLQPRKTALSVLGQGFLILLFFPIAIVAGFLVLLWPVYDIGFVGTILFIVLFDSLIIGYLGRYTAAEFEGIEKGREELASVSARHTTCPHCNSYFVASPGDMGSDGTVTCPHCGQYHTARVSGPAIDDPWSSSDRGLDGW